MKLFVTTSWNCECQQIRPPPRTPRREHTHTHTHTHTHPSTVCPPLKNTYKRTHTSQFAELGGVVDLINDGHQVRAIRNHLVTCAA